MNLRAILQRREALRAELRGILNEHPDGDLPDDVRQRADALEAEATRLHEQEKRQALLDDLDRKANGTPLGGAVSGPELRVFRHESTTAPEGFDGTILRAQNGERVPVLEQRHRLATFA
jgi:hypothetical protein